ncbi:uncharacterized protein MELLADRAFT_72241 [Melampsora larici-populina 98AG31]|uniref:Uncharacterized protein n=1 Tax=Melampsora larici-populina (strain 98AG31 / pathotype 3-4-7) TaxID=747676 RepID=F4RRF0_MELLP|nr:uncharacterized protein MELLADRAFT_72241 [Melampsora larici-populina 98AG31]EGG05044.1 hypothetical protein MELLADRAFT_72241 [Melampsora larici-populina 98AG31]
MNTKTGSLQINTSFSTTEQIEPSSSPITPPSQTQPFIFPSNQTQLTPKHLPNSPFQSNKSNLIQSPTHTLLLLGSGPPSPTPRDDIIEGMSTSTSSIFERDVELLEPNLTAHEATQLAIPSVLDEAVEILTSTTHPEDIILDSSIPSTPPLIRKRPGLDQQISPISSVLDDPPSPLNFHNHHHHQLSDSISSISFTTNLNESNGSPESSSSSPSIIPLSSLNFEPKSDSHSTLIQPRQTSSILHDHHGSSSNRLNFMSYADLINSERTSTIDQLTTLLTSSDLI